MLNNWEKKTIRKGLNQAIAQAATEQWGRLTGKNQRIRKNRFTPSPLSIAHDESEYQIYRGRSVEKALRSLDRLKQGGVPDYDDWDALFYSTWYQPRQVNLVYSILNELKIGGTENSIFKIGDGKIRIIDYGCGCFATNIAVAIAAADLATQDRQVPEILIDNIDNSPAMILSGERIWELFQNEMGVPTNHPICNIFNKMSYETHSSLNTLNDLSPDTTYYVTAIHSAYETTIQQTRMDIDKLARRFNPVGLFFTSHSSKADVIERVPTESVRRNYDEIPTDGPETSLFTGKAVEVFEWRRTLFEKSFKSRDTIYRGVDFNYVKKYLNNPVKWDFNDLALRLYIHRSMSNPGPISSSYEDDLADDLPF